MKKKQFLIAGVYLLLACSAIFAGDKALSLTSSVPESGSKNVAVDSTIVLTFSNNVVNMKVTENNSSCFLLIDGKGNEVDIEVYFPDDQVEPENKRIITLIPSSPLAHNMSYKVVISPKLISKNGSLLEKEVSIGFKTAQ